MYKKFAVVAFFSAAAFLGSASAARADLTISNAPAFDAFTITEAGGCPGGCIPVGQTGYVVNTPAPVTTGQTLSAVGTTAPNLLGGPGFYTFTYLGAGDSSYDNEFTVAGKTFCSQSFAGCNGGVQTPKGSTFTVYLPGGDIPFQFTADAAGAIAEPTGGCVLSNSSITNAGPGGCANYFVGLGSSTITPGLTAPAETLAYIGLTDSPFPGDDDFQDLAVSVRELPIPEPATLAILGTGMAALGVIRRRKAK
jgi:hypothetical protein